MKIELTPDEVNTILAALALYRDDREDAWLIHGWLSDQEEAGSAEWVFEKIAEQREVDRINAEIRERSGWTPKQPEASAPVDPFGMPTMKGV
jgi:hypothetical protein